MSQEIKQLIAKLRGELDKKHEAGLKAIADLEAQLLGTTSTLPLPAESVSSGSPKVELVLASIRDTFKTVPQICQETGLQESEVRAVIYSKYLKVELDKKRIGKAMAHRVAGAKSESSKGNHKPRPARGGGPSVQSQVLEVIKSAGADGISSSGVIATLKLANPRTVGASLYNLKANGHVSHNSDTGIYRIKA